MFYCIPVLLKQTIFFMRDILSRPRRHACDPDILQINNLSLRAFIYKASSAVNGKRISQFADSCDQVGLVYFQNSELQFSLLMRSVVLNCSLHCVSCGVT